MSKFRKMMIVKHLRIGWTLNILNIDHFDFWTFWFWTSWNWTFWSHGYPLWSASTLLTFLICVSSKHLQLPWKFRKNSIWYLPQRAVGFNRAFGHYDFGYFNSEYFDWFWYFAFVRKTLKRRNRIQLSVDVETMSIFFKFRDEVSPLSTDSNK